MATKPRIAPAPGSNPPSALAHQPELNAAFWKLYGALWSRGVLDHRSKEIARIRNARFTNCGL
jgi:hypothetical protein